MRKPEQRTLMYYDYSEIVEYIEEKYSIKTRDYAGLWKHSGDWHRKRGHVGKLDPEGKNLGSSQIWFKEYKEAPDGKAIEPPYEDFWHWMIDEYEPTRDGFIEFFPGRHLVNGDDLPDFVREILTMFKDEFGYSFTVRACW